VALKVLAPWLAENEDALSRFRREVDVLAKLDHPGIVHVITTGRTKDGIAYYTMKLIRGISLSDLVREASQVQGGTLLEPTRSLAAAAHETPSEMGGGNLEAVEPAAGPPKEIIREYVTNRFPFIVRVGIAAARALHAAHQIGQLHRDIKPSNMMIDHHGQLYLVDFGLTRALNPSADVSQLGSIRGTPWYMSPEQARGAPIDQRSDIYSL
jgi:serine/threonine protein kinase